MPTTELDAEWLTTALQASLDTDARVTATTRTSIGTGQVGENVRCSLTWDVTDPRLPTSVVAKLPSTSEVSRNTAVQLDTYVKEVGFYRDLQRDVSIRTPRIHSIDWDGTTHDFVILMEDIDPAVQGDQLAGCTVDQARTAIGEALGLHAPTWGSMSRYGDLAWLQTRAREEDVTLRTQMFGMLAPGFADRYRTRLGADVLDVGSRIVDAFPAWHAAVTRWADAHDALCIVHGDYRLDNMLFGSPPTSPSLTVVDWQTVSVGIGPADVAYFLGAGLLPELRAEVERDLVAWYATGLRERGVEITDDAIWDGYVLGTATGYFMAVLASQIVERTDRGDEMFAVMAERHAAQIVAVDLPGRLAVR